MAENSRKKVEGVKIPGGTKSFLPKKVPVVFFCKLVFISVCRFVTKVVSHISACQIWAEQITK